jgi:hypothetical protein
VETTEGARVRDLHPGLHVVVSGAHGGRCLLVVCRHQGSGDDGGGAPAPLTCPAGSSQRMMLAGLGWRLLPRTARNTNASTDVSFGLTCTGAAGLGAVHGANRWGALHVRVRPGAPIEQHWLKWRASSTPCHRSVCPPMWCCCYCTDDGSSASSVLFQGAGSGPEPRCRSFWRLSIPLYCRGPSCGHLRLIPVWLPGSSPRGHTMLPAGAGWCCWASAPRGTLRTLVILSIGFLCWWHTAPGLLLLCIAQVGTGALADGAPVFEL